MGPACCCCRFGSIGRRHVRILKMLRPDLQITLVRSGIGQAFLKSNRSASSKDICRSSIRAQATIVPHQLDSVPLQRKLRARKPCRLKNRYQTTQGSKLRAMVKHKIFRCWLGMSCVTIWRYGILIIGCNRSRSATCSMSALSVAPTSQIGGQSKTIENLLLL